MKIMHGAMLACILITVSCDYPERFRPIPDMRLSRVRGIELFLTADSILEQETLQARAYIILGSGVKKPAESVSWESLNCDILSVDRDGIVTGLSPGRGALRASMGALSATGTLEVVRRIDYSKIMISEVFYDAAGSDDGNEFIELYNDNEYECDIAGMMVIDGSSSSRAFVFPQGSVIGAGACAVVAQSAGGFALLFGINPDYGNFSFSLNNSGEAVMLMKPDGSVVDTVYIKGGTEDFRPPESWGTALLPASPAGQSVQRVDFSSAASGASWASGPPTPGVR